MAASGHSTKKEYTDILEEGKQVKNNEVVHQVPIRKTVKPLKELVAVIVMTKYVLPVVTIWRKKKELGTLNETRRSTDDDEVNSRRSGEKKSDTHTDKHVDTLEMARQSLKYQGDYEMEVTYGGEADLRLQKTECDKNPGHTNFIAVKKLSVENLPCGLRDNLIVDWIRAQADLTCRLLVGYTSEKRPKFFPGTTQLYPFYNHRGSGPTMLRTGTGWVVEVEKFTENDNKPCQCEGCTRPNMATPKKEWGYIHIFTATHVVYDEMESAQTQCRFFYDDDEIDLNNIHNVFGLELLGASIEGDTCRMRYPTHDMDLINKLDKMWHRYGDLWLKVVAKYIDDRDYSLSSPSTPHVLDPPNNLCIIVSHPHGCSKQVSLGQLTHRWDTGERQKYKDEKHGGREYDVALTQCSYSTPTCRGSSGARVLSPHSRWSAGRKDWWPLVWHPHSQGQQGNKNKSSVSVEFV